MAQPTPLRPDQQTLNARVERQVNAMLVLARRWHMYEADLNRAVQAITETAAVALGVERAGVWLFDDESTAIVCRDLYEAEPHRHSRGFRFVREQFPAYFGALHTEGWIHAVDARSDPRTAGFVASYLDPQNVGALIDIPVRCRGRIAGILRAEHVGGARTFQSDEQTSAAFLAGHVSLALEIQHASDAGGRLRQLETLIQAAMGATGAAVMVLDQGGSVLYYNDAMLELWDMPEELMGPAGNHGNRVQHLADRTTDPARFIARFRRVSADGGERSRDEVTLVDGRVIERTSAPQTIDGKVVGRAWSFRELSPPASG